MILHAYNFSTQEAEDYFEFWASLSCISRPSPLKKNPQEQQQTKQKKLNTERNGWRDSSMCKQLLS